MPLEQHQEKRYPQDVASVFQAGCKAIEKLEGKVVTSDPNAKKIEVRFPKTILGSVLGERTYLTFEARPDGDGALAVVDAYPLDALDRKLLFGARKGVTATVVTWFTAHLEHNLGAESK